MQSFIVALSVIAVGGHAEKMTWNSPIYHQASYESQDQHTNRIFQFPHAHAHDYSVVDHYGPHMNYIEDNVVDGSDGQRTFQQICAKHGFAFEEHKVTTEDGYILTVYRIPGLAGEKVTGEKAPVMMQHGLFDSAFCWIVNGTDNSPAFVAATAGYDVWLGNSRGNTFSRAHTKYDPDVQKKEFWNYTWYDMGAYDVPAVIDYIQSRTGRQKVAYVGHSQGTTQMFSNLSESTYLNDKVPLFVALGPVSKAGQTKVPFLPTIAKFYSSIKKTAEIFGMYELGASSNPDGGKNLCTWYPEICIQMSSAFVNKDPALDDPNSYAVYSAHGPNGTSLKDILHYAQNLQQDRFQIFSDTYDNWFKAEKKTREIPLGNIKVPVAMFTGKEDPIADLADSRWTRDQIGKYVVVHYEEINAGHLSFVVGKDMSFFNKTVMGLLQFYHPSVHHSKAAANSFAPVWDQFLQ